MEKITKRMALSAILSSLNEVATAEGAEFILGSVPGKPTKEGQPTTVDVTVADAIAYCENELNLLASKSGSIKKPTEKQVQNEGFKNAIADYLVGVAPAHKSISEIWENVPELSQCEEMTGQRISALLTQLIKSGEVVRVEEKRKAYFKAA